MRVLTRGQAISLALSYGATARDMAKLSKHGDIHVRALVASRAVTSGKTLSMLASDDDTYVRASAANNPNTPLKALKRLAQDKDDEVVRQLLYNPNLPQDVRFLILLEHPEWANDNR